MYFLTGEYMAKAGGQSKEVFAVAHLSKKSSHSPDEYGMLNVFRRGLNKLTGGW
jgi:hypothetical protein